MPDEIFANQRLAAVYDPRHPDRSDLDVYAAIVDEFGARSILDVGCGTGTFACMLARRGLDVTGVDPAGASLAVAQGKPHSDRVRWINGDATTLPPMQADMATMTGNVAQVFLTDTDWLATLRGVHAALRPDGRLVIETRVPERQAWDGWTREQTESVTDVPGIGLVHEWTDLLDVAAPYVTFRGTFVFASDGAELTSDSTLRFRSKDEIAGQLWESGFMVDEIRDAPDRPGKEYVFVASVM